MTKEEINNLTIEEIIVLIQEAEDNPQAEIDTTKEDERIAIGVRARELLFGGIRIESLTVDNKYEYIPSYGEKVNISIVGSVGAGFSITVKDSSDCSIMEDELENVEIPSNGVYAFSQQFPSIERSEDGFAKTEYYEITLTPHANVKRGQQFTEKITIYQYPVRTVTLNAPTSSAAKITANGRTSGGTDSTIARSGEANSKNVNVDYTWTTTVEESSSTNGFFYIKNTDFAKSITKSSTITKVVDRNNSNPKDKTINLKPFKTGVKGGNPGTLGSIISGDLSVGMRIFGKFEKTKIVTNSLEVPTCKQKTDKFELENTTDLYEGMNLNINGTPVASIVSVDCSRNITLSTKVIIKQNTVALFSIQSGSTVASVVSQVNNDGNACVTTNSSIFMPNGMELEFDDDKGRVVGSIYSNTSGANSITLTKVVSIMSFGTQDVTFTLDLSSIITRKPNIKNLFFETPKNSTGILINLSTRDVDSNKLTKKYTITKNGSHGAALAVEAVGDGINFPHITYVPIAGFTGEDVIKYRVTHDGTTSLVDGSLTHPFSDEKEIRITVK